MKKQFLRVFLLSCLFLQMDYLMSATVFAKHPDDRYKTDIVELQNKHEAMDTSKWLTHPVGRYLIKLPPSAQIKWGPLKFGGRYELTWQKDVSYESALAQLKENENEKKKEMTMEMEDNDWRAHPISTRLQENFSPQKRGTLLTVDYDSPKMDGVSYDMYVVNKKNPMDIDFPERIYYFNKDLVDYQQDLSETEAIWLSHMKGEKERSANTVKVVERFISHVADNIAPHDPSLPIENVRGIYFEGGFLFDPLNDDIVYPKDELIWVEVTFTDYPDIILNISFNDYPGLIAETYYRFDGTPFPPNIVKENTIIAGEPANERLMTFTKNDNTPRYFFELSSPTTTAYFDKFQIEMLLENSIFKNTNYGTREFHVPKLENPSFESNEEAIAFWNAIKENVRWRPDNWKVKAPDTPYFIVYDKIVPAVIPE